MSPTEKPTKDKPEYHLFSDSYRYHGNYNQPTKVKVTRYNHEKIELEEIDSRSSDFRPLVKEGYVNWIQVTGLEDGDMISGMITGFGLHPIDCKAVLTPCHAAKIDAHGDRLIMVMRACFIGKSNKVTSEHIAIISKDNLVVTFREKESPDIFSNIGVSLENDTMNIRSSGRTMLLAFILNSIFSITIYSAVKVEEMLEKLDDLLLDTKENRINAGLKIQQCRHANLIIQKNSIPLHSEFRNIAESPVVTSDPVMVLIFDELYNQLDFIVLTSKNSREMLASMRDMYAASNDIRTNFIIKRLTIVSTLFIPITFLVGLWGMNFRLMPELEWKYGYPAALLTIVLTVYFTWRFMKRNHWF
ncbi:MAG: magnesium and cobalt transport protein CorA [Rikenellaceae bacterium]|nr:magnesium and cobalt transport protein CorA [Rikenellaceae bacterium]